jgi:DNA integrity scanning protein DisA with diadenylate cyclase activity
MTKDQFEAHLSEKYDQHIEPIRVMPKVSAVKFEEAVTMVETVEECNRAEALEKIAELIICEYAVAYEHKEHTA